MDVNDDTVKTIVVIYILFVVVSYQDFVESVLKEH